MNSDVILGPVAPQVGDDGVAGKENEEPTKLMKVVGGDLVFCST